MIIEQALREFSDYGFDIVWKISDKTSQREVARGKTGVLCFNFAKREKTLMPEKLRRILQSA
ncbi:MAG: thioesterase family protein [Spongiibacteraceae bacterium]